MGQTQATQATPTKPPKTPQNDIKNHLTITTTIPGIPTIPTKLYKLNNQPLNTFCPHLQYPVTTYYLSFFGSPHQYIEFSQMLATSCKSNFQSQLFVEDELGHYDAKLTTPEQFAHHNDVDSTNNTNNVTDDDKVLSPFGHFIITPYNVPITTRLSNEKMTFDPQFKQIVKTLLNKQPLTPKMYQVTSTVSTPIFFPLGDKHVIDFITHPGAQVIAEHLQQLISNQSDTDNNDSQQPSPPLYYDKNNSITDYSINYLSLPLPPIYPQFKQPGFYHFDPPEQAVDLVSLFNNIASVPTEINYPDLLLPLHYTHTYPRSIQDLIHFTPVYQYNFDFLLDLPYSHEQPAHHVGTIVMLDLLDLYSISLFYQFLTTTQQMLDNGCIIPLTKVNVHLIIHNGEHIDKHIELTVQKAIQLCYDVGFSTQNVHIHMFGDPYSQDEPIIPLGGDFEKLNIYNDHMKILEHVQHEMDIINGVCERQPDDIDISQLPTLTRPTLTPTPTTRQPTGVLLSTYSYPDLVRLSKLVQDELFTKMFEVQAQRIKFEQQQSQSQQGPSPSSTPPTSPRTSTSTNTDSPTSNQPTTTNNLPQSNNTTITLCDPNKWPLQYHIIHTAQYYTWLNGFFSLGKEPVNFKGDKGLFQVAQNRLSAYLYESFIANLTQQFIPQSLHGDVKSVNLLKYHFKNTLNQQFIVQLSPHHNTVPMLYNPTPPPLPIEMFLMWNSYVLHPKSLVFHRLAAGSADVIYQQPHFFIPQVHHLDNIDINSDNQALVEMFKNIQMKLQQLKATTNELITSNNIDGSIHSTLDLNVPTLTRITLPQSPQQQPQQPQSQQSQELSPIEFSQLLRLLPPSFQFNAFIHIRELPKQPCFRGKLPYVKHPTEIKADSDQSPTCAKLPNVLNDSKQRVQNDADEVLESLKYSMLKVWPKLYMLLPNELILPDDSNVDVVTGVRFTTIQQFDPFSDYLITAPNQKAENVIDVIIDEATNPTNTLPPTTTNNSDEIIFDEQPPSTTKLTKFSPIPYDESKKTFYSGKIDPYNHSATMKRSHNYLKTHKDMMLSAYAFHDQPQQYTFQQLTTTEINHNTSVFDNNQQQHQLLDLLNQQVNLITPNPAISINYQIIHDTWASSPSNNSPFFNRLDAIGPSIVSDNSNSSTSKPLSQTHHYSTSIDRQRVNLIRKHHRDHFPQHINPSQEACDVQVTTPSAPLFKYPATLPCMVSSLKLSTTPSLWYQQKPFLFGINLIPYIYPQPHLLPNQMYEEYTKRQVLTPAQRKQRDLDTFGIFIDRQLQTLLLPSLQQFAESSPTTLLSSIFIYYSYSFLNPHFTPLYQLFLCLNEEIFDDDDYQNENLPNFEQLIKSSSKSQIAVDDIPTMSTMSLGYKITRQELQMFVRQRAMAMVIKSLEGFIPNNSFLRVHDDPSNIEGNVVDMPLAPSGNTDGNVNETKFAPPTAKTIDGNINEMKFAPPTAKTILQYPPYPPSLANHLNINTNTTTLDTAKNGSIIQNILLQSWQFDFVTLSDWPETFQRIQYDSVKRRLLQYATSALSRTNQDGQYQ